MRLPAAASRTTQQHKRTLSERVTKKIFSKREVHSRTPLGVSTLQPTSSTSLQPHPPAIASIPRSPNSQIPSIPQIPQYPSFLQYPLIPHHPSTHSSPSPNSFIPLPFNPHPRVPTGTHQSFQKEIMAELIRHSLPTKIISKLTSLYI